MARILHGGSTYRPYEYGSEEEFEQAVIEHSREIFGPDSVYFDIKKRLGNENVLTIPDGYLFVKRSAESARCIRPYFSCYWPGPTQSWFSFEYFQRALSSSRIDMPCLRAVDRQKWTYTSHTSKSYRGGSSKPRLQKARLSRMG